ncbi:glycosyltransferase family 2 protein [Methylomonas sp. MgM2]
MPCYNAQKFLNSTISCVFGQTYSNIELIVIDDGSSDNSPEILQDAISSNKKIKVIRQQNQGPYPARNLGLKHARGELIAFLDADDYWSPDCIQKLHKALIDKNAELSYCGWQNVVEDGQNGPPYIPPDYAKNDIVLSFLSSGPWPIHAALIRKSVVDQVHGFSTKRFSSMDYDFWLRICTVTRRIVQVPEVLAYYRWHNQGQISAVKWKQVIDAWHVKKDFYKNYPDIIAHIPAKARSEIINDFLITQAYTAFWKRDLLSAQRLFRRMFLSNTYRFSDLPYIATSFLPYRLFSGLVNYISTRNNE